MPLKHLIQRRFAKTSGNTFRVAHYPSETFNFGETTIGRLDSTRSQSCVLYSGTVTANAGTNLNTSALALETGGNLAAKTSLNTLAGAVSAV